MMHHHPPATVSTLRPAAKRRIREAPQADTGPKEFNRKTNPSENATGIDCGDIDMIIKGFQSVAYPVAVSDCQTIASCPLGGEGPCIP